MQILLCMKHKQAIFDFSLDEFLFSDMPVFYLIDAFL